MGVVIGAGAAIVGGVMSSNASKHAADQQAFQQQQGLDFQKSVYGNTMTNLGPFIGGGQSALQSLLGFYGLPGGDAGGAAASFNQFTGLPAYQFPLQQGTLAMNRQLASSGLIGSGAALRDSNALAQGYASQGFGGYLSGLSGLVNMGQNSAVMTGSQGNTAATTMLQGYTGIGNAQAAGTIGANNGITQGIQNALPYITGSPQPGGGNNSGGSSYGGGLLGNFSNMVNPGYVDNGTWSG